MKAKNIFITLGLSCMALAGLGAAGLMSNTSASQVKAEGEKTWMFRAQLDLAEASPDIETPCFAPANCVDRVQFHYWGSNVDEKVDAYFMDFSTFDFYGVNVALRDDQTITGAQWVLHQKDIGDKYSIDINQFGNSAADHLDKDTNIIAIQWQFDNSWTGDKWKFTGDVNWGSPITSLQAHINGQDPVDFVKEPQINAFAVRNLVQSDYSKWIELVDNGSARLEGSFCAMLDAASQHYRHGGANQWTYLNENGTYDIIYHSDRIELRKLESKDDTFIYYVTASASATTDYIYSWGGSEQFGAFPGTSIASLVAADKAREVTGNGVVHFQGGDTAKLVYRIDISKGYPNGDLMFMFNNGTSEYKSAERVISNEHAYWWTGDANHDAAQSLNFIITLEAYRNGATDYSVCNIDKASAKFLVDLYNAYDASTRTTYIDCTTIYTWADSTKASNTLVTVRAIMEQLSEIAEEPLGGTNRINAVKVNTATIIVVVSVMVIASASLVAVLVIKKRKHE